eukprot:COSAG01_NODE_15351_length_1347_cov_1.386218_3_plen_110_part_00
MFSSFGNLQPKCCKSQCTSGRSTEQKAVFEALFDEDDQMAPRLVLKRMKEAFPDDFDQQNVSEKQAKSFFTRLAHARAARIHADGAQVRRPRVAPRGTGAGAPGLPTAP